MAIFNWLRFLRNHVHQSSARRAHLLRASARTTRTPVVLEALERRLVLAAPHPFDLSTLNGSNGFRLDGIDESDFSGFAVSSAGDVNGDGFDDVLIGALGGESNNAVDSGETYVVFGRASGFNASTELATLDGTNGFRLDGFGSNLSGSSVSSAGDVNGDGFDDVIVGARGGYSTDSQPLGDAYIVFGRLSGFSAALDLSTLNGINGFRVYGVLADSFTERAVSSAGDVNGDGFDDVIIGASRGDPDGIMDAGVSYVVFGKASGFAAALDLSTLNGKTGFRINGTTIFDYSGSAVSSAGDINGDGFGDLLVGAAGVDATSNHNDEGATFVVFGKDSGFGAVVAISDLNGSNGFRLISHEALGLFGGSVSSAGDVNGDGFGDLIIGAEGASNESRYAGKSYVVFGRDGGFSDALSVTTLNGTTGFAIDGINPNDLSGHSVSCAGDVNGDGFDDLIVGAHGSNPHEARLAGESYIIFGKSNVFEAVLELSSLNGTNGFRIEGIDAHDNSGFSVSSAGDVNGDGFDDVVIGALRAAPNGNTYAGESYVVFGGNFTGGAETQVGTNAANTLTANQGAIAIDVLIGQQGDDTLIADGGSDVLIGGQGDDGFEISDFGFHRIAGGSGSDAVRLVGGGLALSLTAIADNKLTDIEVIDITGSGNNSLVLNQLEVLNLSSTSNTLVVRGNAGDSVARGLGWTAGPNETIGSETFAVFTQGAARLKVQSAVMTSVLGAFIDLSTLNGTNGFRLDGIDELDFSGFAVSSAGDVNGDGFDDLLIGAHRGDPNEDFDAGESYVVFGKSTGFDAALDLATLDGMIGFRLDGTDATDRSGNAVSNAGDVNGDGFDDLLIGAFFASSNGDSAAGASYVLFGKSSSFEPVVDLATLDGTTGFRLDGIDRNDFSGCAVSGAGDVNGDGFEDLLIGASGGDPNGNRYAGESYLVFGKSGGFAAVMDLATLDGKTGFRIDGIEVVDQSGLKVSNAGDVNGDGFDDLLIGASYATRNGNLFVGESYVVFGKSSGFDAALDLSTLDGMNGFQLDGIDPRDYSSSNLSTAGDVNGDGFDDLLIGARGGAPNGNKTAGESYVVFGRSSGFGRALDLATLDGTTGFRLDGIDAGGSGYAVSNAGDVNADGFDDLLIGAPGRHLFAGESYLVFGMSSGFGAVLDLATLDGTTGFRLIGIDQFDESGFAVSGAGDVNGDGFYDLLIGANGADPNGDIDAGESYVLFGGNFTGGAETQVGSSEANTLTANRGRSSKDVLIGHQGNDRLLSDGGPDVLIGGQGDDRFEIFDFGFQRIAGGSGRDALRLVGGGLTFDLSAIADNKLTDIEVIDISGSGNNTLTLNRLEVLNLSSTSNMLIVRRNGGDRVNMGSGWIQGTNRIIGTTTFNVFAQGAATLLVQEVDTTPPTLSITPNAGVTNASSIVFTFQFSEPVMRFDADDVIVSNGSKGAFSVVDHDTYTLVVSPTSDGAVTVSVAANAAQDDATNGNLAASSSVVSDRTRPTLAVTPAFGISSANALTFTFQFSEVVTGFTASDVVVTNGTTGEFAAIDGDTYSLMVTPTADGTVSVTVGSAAARDAALNGNRSTQGSIVVDRASPTVSIGAPSRTTTQLGPVSFPINFADTNFKNSTLTASDVILNSTGTATGVISVDAGTGASRIVTINNISGEGTLGITLKAGTASDKAGNVALASSPSATFDVRLGITVTRDRDGNLVISDTKTANANDTLTITADNATRRLVIHDLDGLVTASAPGAVRIDDHTVEIPYSRVTGPNVIINANLGDDTLVLKSINSGAALAKTFVINGGAGLDTITLDGSLRSRFTGMMLLDGGSEDDVISATAIVGTGSFAVRVNGGPGNDLIRGGDGDDVLQGSDGNDTLIGGRGNDQLRGNLGDDQFTGGLGDDSLDGGPGTDTVVESGNVNFLLTNTELTGLGIDTLQQIERAQLTGGSGANRFDASAFMGKVTLAGGSGNDTLIGGSSNDVLIGGSGDDELSGNAGLDRLDGNLGNDKLQGDLGFDTLSGGAGSDTLDAADSETDSLRYDLLDTLMRDAFDLLTLL